MYEPTQEIILSELRRRDTASIADLLHFLGPDFASIIPEEIQRMKHTAWLSMMNRLGLILC